jgi:hypothetical protein
VKTLTHAQIGLLRDAIEAADTWKGALHPEDFAEHDEKIRAMKQALKLVREQQKVLAAMRSAMRKAVNEALKDPT